MLEPRSDFGDNPEWDEDSPAPHERSLADELRALIGSARAMADAELAYQKTRAGLMAKAGAWIAGSAMLALTLGFFVLIALVVGLLLALTPVLGAWGALGVVVGGLLIVMAVAGLVAWLNVKKFLALLQGGKEPA